MALDLPLKLVKVTNIDGTTSKFFNVPCVELNEGFLHLYDFENHLEEHLNLSFVYSVSVCAMPEKTEEKKPDSIADYIRERSSQQ
jgi:hypothetical protein